MVTNQPVWVVERGSRTPSGKSWWFVKNQRTGEVWATDRKWVAVAQAEWRNSQETHKA